MDLKQILVEALIAFIIFDLIYFPFVMRQKKKNLGKRYMWGIYLTVLGSILTLFGLFLIVLGIIYQGWVFSIETLAGIGPFLVVGIPSLAIGIFFIKNP